MSIIKDFQFGEYGVLTEDKNGKILCHLCGNLYLNISTHLTHSHSNISSQEYRLRTGLKPNTFLVSKITRQRLLKAFLKKNLIQKENIIKLLQNNLDTYRQSNNNAQNNQRLVMKNKYIKFFKQNGRLPTWGESKKIGLLDRDAFQRIFSMNKTTFEKLLRQSI